MDKLKEYFKSHGIQQKWFASQLKISDSHLNAWLGKRAPIARTYWEDICALTGNRITMTDMLQYSLEYKNNIKKKVKLE